MQFFMNDLNSTFRFLSEHACMNRGSTVGKNLNDDVEVRSTTKDVSWVICRY